LVTTTAVASITTVVALGPLEFVDGRFLGIAGLFSWTAIAIYNVTQDSFAIPNIWINFGVLVGMSVFNLESENSLQEPSAPTGQVSRLTPEYGLRSESRGCCLSRLLSR
jgi:hypothetical protein